MEIFWKCNCLSAPVKPYQVPEHVPHWQGPFPVAQLRPVGWYFIMCADILSVKSRIDHSTAISCVNTCSQITGTKIPSHWILFNSVNCWRCGSLQRLSSSVFLLSTRQSVYWQIPLFWRHNGCGGVSNHQPHDCLLNRLFRRRSK